MIKVKFLNEKAKCPSRNTASDAGLDIYSCEDIAILPKSWHAVSTGISISIPDSHYARVAPRSGLALKHGVDVFAGVVDSGYRGEIKAILYNASNDNFIINIGDKIAQLIISECKLWNPEIVDSLDESDRGQKGFGSSGK
jgi:dUTP pyrophosphatase